MPPFQQSRPVWPRSTDYRESTVNLMPSYPEYEGHPPSLNVHVDNVTSHNNSSAYDSPTEEKDAVFEQTVLSPLKNNAFVIDVHETSRTPSPTPKEAEELALNGFIDWKAMRTKRFWLRKSMISYYVTFAVILTFTILFSAFHNKIIQWLTPAFNWLHDAPAGWLIPIVILVAISFPPLFGHEIVAILCGAVWGLWAGFGIVAAGTYFGELANFYAFRSLCSARGHKYEREQTMYGCLAKVVRDGGFKIALIARFSAIPGHFTTAVFSTCGMSVWTFSLAAILSLPKQFVTVYIGVALDKSGDGNESTSTNVVKYIVLAITTIVTIVAMRYIYGEMNKVKADVIYARRKARQAKLQRATSSVSQNGAPASLVSTTSAFASSSSDLPLSSKAGAAVYQQWDASGRPNGYASSSHLVVPQPLRAASRETSLAPTHRPQTRSPHSAVVANLDAQLSSSDRYPSDAIPMQERRPQTAPLPYGQPNLGSGSGSSNAAPPSLPPPYVSGFTPMKSLRAPAQEYPQ